MQHNLRYYPVVQQIRQMIAHGDLGEILIVQGTYSQDWLLYDTDWNWRLDAKSNGALRVMGDIGSHWMDMIQHLTGLSITAVCADLSIFNKTRKRPKGSVETFSAKKAAPAQYETFAVETEDFGMAMLKLGDRARGAIHGKSDVGGPEESFRIRNFWNKGRRGVEPGGARHLVDRASQRAEPDDRQGASLFYPEAAAFADLPGGHSEGYDDSHKQVFKHFYARVANRSAPVEYPTLEDGLRGMILLEKVAESSRRQTWVKV